jgi:hypothetical protein
MIFPRTAMKPVFQDKEPLAEAEQLFLPIRLPVRCRLITRISQRRHRIRMQQSSLMDRPALIPALMPKRRHKTRMQQ